MRVTASLRLFRFLEEKIGEKIPYRELKHLFIVPGKATKDRRGRSPSDLKRGGYRKKRNTSRQVLSMEEFEASLSALSELELIQRDKKFIWPKKSFQVSGRLSISPRKIAYLDIQNLSPSKNRDRSGVIIPQAKQKGALTGDRVLVKLTDYFQGRLGGAVLKVLEPARSQYRIRLLGGVKQNRRNRFIIAQILDILPNNLHAALSLSSVPPESAKGLGPNDVIIVSLDGQELYYERRYYYKAHFIRREEETALDKDLSRILMKYDLSPSYPDFGGETLEAKEKFEEIEKENTTDWKERKDLRELYTITIDGENSKDFDDALSFSIVSQEEALLYVHIADVSHYVIPNSPLDLEAQKRGTSYYLADSVIPMLPPQLSENLCSLIAHKNRLALTAEMKINLKTGSILGTSFYRSIIRVDRRFTYGEAEEKIERTRGGAAALESLAKIQKEGAFPRPASDFESVFLRALWELSKNKRRGRMKRGRVDFSFPEPAFHYNSSGRIQSVKYKKRLRSSILIEECMLSANNSVASFLEKKKIPHPYRCHDSMDLEKLEQINAFCSTYQIPVTLKDNSYAAISEALKIIEEGQGNEKKQEKRPNTNAKNFMRLFQIMLLRSFPQAYYTPHNIGHWGLGFSSYCHFTSPIRRYPDLLVHRMLISFLEKKKPLYDMARLEELGQKNSEAERKAIDAERDTMKLKIMRYLIDAKIKECSAFITGIRPERIYLEMKEIPVELIVEAEHLGSEEPLQIENFSVYVKKLGRFAYLGEEWELTLERVDLEGIQAYCRPLFF